MKRDKARELEEQTFLRSFDDPVVFILRNINLPQNRKWDFVDRKWQLKIIEDKSPFIDIKKSAQVGLSLTFTSKMLYILSTASTSCMYTLPRLADIGRYTNSILNPIIQRSPHLHSVISDTNSVSMKKFKTTVPCNGGALRDVESLLLLTESSTTPRMSTVDFLVNDEIDMSDTDNLDQFIARLDQSPDPRHYRFSTPTIPDYGIDKMFQNTTQNVWIIKCSRCSTEQQLDWDVNFVAEPTPRYICCQCKEPLRNEDIIDGQWVALYPNRDIIGYHISHMMMPISRPVIGLWKELSENRITKKNFYNLRLGMPFSSAQGSFTEEMFAKKVFDAPHHKEEYPSEDGSYYLGCDQGNNAYIVIMKDCGTTKRIVYAEKTNPQDRVWNERVIELIKRFRVKFAVVDALPNTHDAREIWQSVGEFSNRVALCHYSEQENFIKRDKENGKVHVSRVELFDKLHDQFANGEWKIFNDSPQTAKEIQVHFINLKRDEVPDAKGVPRGRWVNSGADHYAHATAYALLGNILKPSDRILISDLSENDKKDDGEPRSDFEKIWGYPRPELENDENSMLHTVG